MRCRWSSSPHSCSFRCVFYSLLSSAGQAEKTTAKKKTQPWCCGCYCWVSVLVQPSLAFCPNHLCRLYSRSEFTMSFSACLLCFCCYCCCYCRSYDRISLLYRAMPAITQPGDQFGHCLSLAWCCDDAKSVGGDDIRGDRPRLRRFWRRPLVALLLGRNRWCRYRMTEQQTSTMWDWPLAGWSAMRRTCWSACLTSVSSVPISIKHEKSVYKRIERDPLIANRVRHFTDYRDWGKQITAAIFRKDYHGSVA